LLAETINWRFPILTVVLLEDMNLAVADVRPIIFIWNFRRKLQVQQLFGLNSHAFDLVHVQNEILASCGNERTIKIWNCTDGRLAINLTDHTDIVNKLALLKNKNLISCLDDATIKIWNTLNYEVVLTLKGHKKEVFFAFPLTNYKIASASQDSTIRIWNIKKTESENTVTIQHYGFIVSNCLALLSNGHLASGDSDSLEI
jgi:WD40 repeat protein